MIQDNTRLNVADNSGAKKVMCIKVLGGSKRKFASVGDIIVVAVKVAIPNAPIKKGEVRKAVIVRVHKEYRGKEGPKIRFDNKAGFILEKKGVPSGKRTFGPVERELRVRGIM